MDADFIDFNEVHRLTGYSRAHIDRLEKHPTYMGDDPFPVRFRYGNFRVMWSRREVVAWLERRIRRDGTRIPPVPKKKREKDVAPVPQERAQD
jgi:predicted DNA-binding transcriptional regulator AlpA